MWRLARAIFSWIDLLLIFIAAWILLKSIDEPRVLSYTTKLDRTILTVVDGCFEYGRAARVDQSDPNWKRRNKLAGWNLGDFHSDLGELPLPSLLPGYLFGSFQSDYEYSYNGVVIAGYWILLILVLPAVPLLWRWRRLLLLRVIPLATTSICTALWLRSYWIADNIDYWNPQNSEISIGSESGTLQIGRNAGYDTNRPPCLTWDHDPGTGPVHFADGVSTYGGRAIIPGGLTFVGGQYPTIWIHDWLIALPIYLLTLPIAGFEIRRHVRRWRSARRTNVGLCGHCGYDLRESPDRCPECGRLAV